MNGDIATAIAALASQINAALLAGDSTAELRRELAELEQRRRREAAEAAAAEREGRAAQEAEERAEIDARAAALASEVRARIDARMAPLAMPEVPLAIRRHPNGRYEPISED